MRGHGFHCDHIPLGMIADVLGDAPVIVEAGAADGIDTLRFAARWPAAVIHAFEPVPELFAKLDAATRGSPRIHRHALALHDRHGAYPMRVSSGASVASSSLLEPGGHLARHPAVQFDSTIVVPTSTLDTWAERTGVAAIDLLWLDLQGHELAVLQAAPRILATVRAIHTEVSSESLYVGDALYPELARWLHERGFLVEYEALSADRSGNVLFVREADAARPRRVG